MYNHNKAQQSKNRVHISWDILYSLLSFQHKNICLVPVPDDGVDDDDDDDGDDDEEEEEEEE